MWRLPPAQDSHPSVSIVARLTLTSLRLSRVTNSAFAIETFLDGTRTDEAHISEMAQKGEFLVAQEATLINVATDVCASEPGSTCTMGSTIIPPNMTACFLGEFRPCRGVVLLW